LACSVEGLPKIAEQGPGDPALRHHVPTVTPDPEDPPGPPGRRDESSQEERQNGYGDKESEVGHQVTCPG